MAGIPGSLQIKKPRTRLGSYVLGKLVSDMQEKLKDFIAEGIPIPLLKTMFNNAVNVWFLVKLTNNIEYADHFTLPILRSVLSNKQTGSAYDNTTQVLTLKTIGDQTQWKRDGSLQLSDQFSLAWVGTVMTLTDTSGPTPVNYSVTILDYIETVNNLSKVLVLPSGVVPAIVAANLIVQGNTEANKQNNDLDLTEFDDYTRIYRLIKVMDSLNGLCIGSEIKGPDGKPKIDPLTFEGIKSTHNQTWSNYASQVIHNRLGETDFFSRGGKTTAYGTRTYHVILFPLAMIEDDDEIDVQDIYVPDINKIVTLEALSTMPKEMIRILPSPEDLKWYQDLVNAARAKQIENAT